VKPDGVSEIFVEAMDTRFALAIMSLLMSLLFIVAFAVMRPTMCCPGSSGGAKISDTPSPLNNTGGDVEIAKAVEEDNSVQPITNE
jgi:hypothetical protein